MGNKSHIPKVLFSRTLFAGLIIVLLVVSFSMLREVRRKQQIQQEILQLEHSLVSMEHETSRLEHVISYLQTDEYAELEAKKRMGMKKPGEKVILVTEAAAAGTELNNDYERMTPNWQRWWSYFFN